MAILKKRLFELMRALGANALNGTAMRALCDTKLSVAWIEVRQNKCERDGASNDRSVRSPKARRPLQGKRNDEHLDSLLRSAATVKVSVSMLNIKDSSKQAKVNRGPCLNIAEICRRMRSRT